MGRLSLLDGDTAGVGAAGGGTTAGGVTVAAGVIAVGTGVPAGVAGRSAGWRCSSGGIAVKGCAGGGIIGVGTAFATTGSTMRVSRLRIVPSSFWTVTVHVPGKLGEMFLLECTRQGLPVTGNCKPN